jgi:hypothetical protein
MRPMEKSWYAMPFRQIGFGRAAWPNLSISLHCDVSHVSQSGRLDASHAERASACRPMRAFASKPS